MKKHMILKAILAVLGFAAFVPALALAQTSASVGTNLDASVVPTSASAGVHVKVMASTTAETTKAATAKTKADEEISRRITSLNDLLTRVDAMTKVSDTLKANLASNVQTEITGFTALEAKIDADTDLPTLKTDVQSITQSYRIYMLVIPQGRITAAADRMATIINMMSTVGTKVEARINSAKAGGADTTALEASLTDFGTQLTSAQTHAQAAVGDVAPLTPDNGDKTIMASNDTAIKNAQGEIKAGQAALVAARKDMGTIIKGLAGLKVSASASTTVQQ